MYSMKIILDTNIILYAAKQKVDLVSSLKERFGQTITLIVPDLVKEELASLTTSAKKGADKRAAKLALQIVEFSKLKEMKISKPVDNGLTKLAKKEKALVATNDAELRRNLRKEGIRVIFLRQNKLIGED